MSAEKTRCLRSLSSTSSVLTSHTVKQFLFNQWQRGVICGVSDKWSTVEIHVSLWNNFELFLHHVPISNNGAQLALAEYNPRGLGDAKKTIALTCEPYQWSEAMSI